MKALPLQKIVSGGQTGADRAALDWAIEFNVPHGGWCPHGRLAEDGCIAAAYQLVETPSSSYAQRTEWNVRDSDGTVLFTLSRLLRGGTLLTRLLADRHHKPWLHLAASGPREDQPGRLQEFLIQNGIRVLNVAGPRASNEPGITKFVREMLTLALSSF